MVGKRGILEKGDGYLPGEERETMVLAKTQLVKLSAPNTWQNRATENSVQKPNSSVKVEESLKPSLVQLSGPGLAFRVRTCISQDPTRKTETTLWIENREFGPRIWLYR